MAKFIGRLSSLQLRRAGRGKYNDGGGLYARIEANGMPPYFYFRYGSKGKHEHGLGRIALADAREERDKCRQLLRQGIDPIAAGKARRAAVRLAEINSKTFQWCTEQFHAAHCARDNRTREGMARVDAGTRAAQDRQRNSRRHRHCRGGARVGATVAQCSRDGKQAAFAHRERARLGAGARLSQRRKPSAWKGHLDNLLPSRQKRERVRHHAALPYLTCPRSCAGCAEHDENEAAALEYIILTCARANQLRRRLERDRADRL